MHHESASSIAPDCASKGLSKHEFVVFRRCLTTLQVSPPQLQGCETAERHIEACASACAARGFLPAQAIRGHAEA